MIDHYQTLSGPAESSARIQRSEFRAFAIPLAREDDFGPWLKELAKTYFDATHHCWAYRMVIGDAIRERSSDAGEPTGSAGKPILSAIGASGLLDLAVVVVRWYGGVKLGTGGLGRAYREAAQSALASAARADRYVYTRFEVEVPYESMSTLYRRIAPPDIVLAGEEFGERTIFSIDVRRSREGELARWLEEKRLVFRRA